MRFLQTTLALIVLWICCTTHFARAQQKPVAQIERVLIISLDGLRPDLLLRADAPNLHRLMEAGTYTMWARTTAASTTLPSHVSMLTGVAPEVHGITWNDHLPLSQRVYPRRATLFKMAKRAGLTTALAAGKQKFEILDEAGALDWKSFTTGDGEDSDVMPRALEIIRAHRPNVMVIHLPTIDNTGHSKGWASPEQMQAISRADGWVGQALALLDELALRDSTLVIISADHGGAGRTHGPEDPRSRTIPWIASGPGIRKNFDLTRIADLEIETFDTFTTACTVLGIPVNHRVRGKFVAQILEDRQLLEPAARRARPANPPTTSPATQP